MAGYYRLLTAFLDHVVAEQFLRPAHRAMLQVAEEPEALLAQLEAWRPIAGTKWMTPDER